MLLRQVAIVSRSTQIRSADVAAASAAIQKQVTRDFAPIWEIKATVDYFEKTEQVPLGYWPIIIEDDIHQPGAGGVHLDKKNQPYALVKVSPNWTLSTSHEALEMLADPTGNHLTAGNSPKKGEGRVEFLVEVCDPCEDPAYAYRVNGVTVSDFYTPHYFDPISRAGVQYSFTGAITKPRQVLKGGYLIWHDPANDHWYQYDYLGPKPRIRDLGPMNVGASIRATFDTLRPPPAWRV